MNLEKNSSLIVICISFLVWIAPLEIAAQTTPVPVGLFETHADVGPVLHPGSVDFDSATQTYSMTGSGENMWFAADAFHFAWKKVSGNVSLTADISFANAGGNAHKKAVLMFRQSLDPDSIYADVALHGNGMTALQFRDEKGVLTREVQSNLSAPARLRIVKQGDFIYLWLADAGGEFKVAGASARIPLQGTFYVGIGVCSHDKDAIEKAMFSKVEIAAPPAPTGEPKLYSTLEAVAISSADRRVVYVAPEHFEAPNWTRDGAAFLFNGNGHILRLPVAGGTPVTIDTGFATRCNNDHGISPDSKWLAISDQSQEDHKSLVYMVPIDGGTPRRITKNSPSYWHGWSPDGKRLPSLASVTAISISTPSPSQAETKPGSPRPKASTTAPSIRRTGNTSISTPSALGRCRSGGCSPTAARRNKSHRTNFNNWFPHISPDGKWMVFLSYEKDVTGHPENKNVMLRLMSLARQEDQRAGQTVWRAGHDQRSFLVARQQAGGLRQLRTDSIDSRYQVSSRGPAWIKPGLLGLNRESGYSSGSRKRQACLSQDPRATRPKPTSPDLACPDLACLTRPRAAGIRTDFSPQDILFPSFW